MFTGFETDAPDIRLAIEPSGSNALSHRSWLMTDKVITVPRTKVGERVGRLGDIDIARLNRAIAIFLGLTE